MGRGGYRDHHRYESCDCDKTSHTDIDKEHTWYEKDDHHKSGEHLTKKIEEYDKNVIRTSHELFREFSGIGIHMISDREIECVHEVFADNGIELFMCHTISIDRDKELQYDNGNTDDAPKNKSL